MIRRIFCFLGFHVGKWESEYTASWRVCNHCARTERVNRSYM